MGDVGAVLPDNPCETPTINGEINGVCRPTEKMEIDNNDCDSQISSENGVSDSSEKTPSTNIIIAKAESLNKNDPSLKQTSKISTSCDIINTENDKNTLELIADSTSETKDEIIENGIIMEKNSPCKEDNLSENTNKPSLENGEMNSIKTIDNTINDEIQIIESDEEVEEIESSIESETNIENNQSTNQENKSEQMEVDSTTNSNTLEEKCLSSVQNDDDAAVVIQSDSEGESDSITSDIKPANTTESQSIVTNLNIDENEKTDDDVQEVLSDKDDCVVIEDDYKKENDSISRPNNRQRKSAVKVRDISDFDDDISEVIDDSPLEQPPLKRSRTSPALPPQLALNIGQIGQITIKDARTLMGPFIDSSQNSFTQHNITGKNSKDPGLVLVDNNAVLKNSSSQINSQLNKQNTTFPVLPVGLQGQNIYPLNIRPGLAPLSTPPKLVPTTPLSVPQLPITSPNLLPALTDDMFVLEAPSFIVPYIYEKPPSENLKDIVLKLGLEVEKIKNEFKEEKMTEGGGDRSQTSDTKETETKNLISKKKKKSKNPDDSWGETDTSTDDEASDKETRTKVLIKEAKEDLDTIKAHIIVPDIAKNAIQLTENDKKTENFFESPLGKFFSDIGIGLVQEYVQADLLRVQKRKRDRAGKNSTSEMDTAIITLKKNLETSRKRNDAFKFEMKRCEYCNFKSESALVMAHHYETPHMRQTVYKCNFCSFETRPPHDILFHMEAVHNVKGRLEKAPLYHKCPNCPFEDNGKSKIARHAPICVKKFRPELNLSPSGDWEAPAKIPRIKPRHGLVGTATAYQAMAAQAAAQKAAFGSLPIRGTNPINSNTTAKNRRPQNRTTTAASVANLIRGTQPIRPQMGMVLTNSYQVAPGQLLQVAGSSLAVLPNSHTSLAIQQQNSKKSGQQPSISITPLPRQPVNTSNSTVLQSSVLSTAIKPPSAIKPGQSPSGGKASFVICEICDGYIKDLEQLRNHMQWMHKVKIHPKMIYNRPPLNCQKCQFRFFTDQGLERHLLGSHGLVTSSMQEAANKAKDAGRCPVCGRMYQWKLLNHVSRDHNMTLKPAHLSYKCTVCTATFGMYKQFENHVYTAHSTVAKKAMDSKKSANNNSSSGSVSNMNSSSNNFSKANLSSFTGGDSLLKPLKINDEITIIPQPATKSRGTNDLESHVIDLN